MSDEQNHDGGRREVLEKTIAKLLHRHCNFGWANYYIPWVLGPFFGESPETYFAHHVGMHHAENNLEDDISTTLPYVRDSAVDFGHAGHGRPGHSGLPVHEGPGRSL